MLGDNPPHWTDLTKTTAFFKFRNEKARQFVRERSVQGNRVMGGTELAQTQDIYSKSEKRERESTNS